MGSEQAYRDGEAQGSDRATTPGGEVIVELRRLEAAATPRPWWPLTCELTGRQIIKFRARDVPTWIAEASDRPEAIADFEFIAAARNAIPSLLAIVDALTKRAEAAEAVGYARGVEEAAGRARSWSLPGPDGIDMTGGIPPEIYIGIVRDDYDDEYELAADVASAARGQISEWIMRLLPATPAPAEKGQVQP